MIVRSRPWNVAAVLSIALIAGLTACGDDAESADIADACEAHGAMSVGYTKVLTSTPEPPDGAPPPAELVGQVQAAYDANVAGPLATLVGSAPDEVRDEVGEVATKSREFRATADRSVLLSSDYSDLIGTVDAYMHENCTGAKATVDAVNYAYEGLPATLPAGTVRIEMENTSDEAHEMLVFSKNPGVTESFDQILELPDDQAETKVAFANAVSTDPGQTAYMVTALPVGDYLFICNYGKGTTDDDDPTTAEPHYTLGMKQEVKVA